jgi:UDP-sugar pyrophosphorylase
LPTAQTKPHGHGDVHSLLHSSGLARAWQQAGLQWVCFFQVCVYVRVVFDWFV